MRDHQWHGCNVIVAHEPAASQTASISRTIWRATGETGKDARLSSNCRQFDVRCNRNVSRTVIRTRSWSSPRLTKQLEVIHFGSGVGGIRSQMSVSHPPQQHSRKVTRD